MPIKGPSSTYYQQSTLSTSTTRHRRRRIPTKHDSFQHTLLFPSNTTTTTTTQGDSIELNTLTDRHPRNKVIVEEKMDEWIQAGNNERLGMGGKMMFLPEMGGSSFPAFLVDDGGGGGGGANAQAGPSYSWNSQQQSNHQQQHQPVINPTRPPLITSESLLGKRSRDNDPPNPISNPDMEENLQRWRIVGKGGRTQGEECDSPVVEMERDGDGDGDGDAVGEMDVDGRIGKRPRFHDISVSNNSTIPQTSFQHFTSAADVEVTQRTQSLRIDQVMSIDDHDHDHGHEHILSTSTHAASTPAAPISAPSQPQPSIQHHQGIPIRQPQVIMASGMESELHHAAARMLHGLSGINGGVHFTTPESSFNGGGGGGGLSGLVMSPMGEIDQGKGINGLDSVSMHSTGGRATIGSEEREVSMNSTSPGVERYWMEGMHRMTNSTIEGGEGEHVSNLSLPLDIGRGRGRSGTITQYGFMVPDQNEQQQHQQQHQQHHQQQHHHHHQPFAHQPFAHQPFAHQPYAHQYENSPPNMYAHFNDDPFNKQQQQHDIHHQEHAFPGYRPITLDLNHCNEDGIADHDMAGFSGMKAQQDQEMGEPGGNGRTPRTKYTMGPRVDCEKCRVGTAGHFGHWQ